MERFIIGHGLMHNAEFEVIGAQSLREAYAKAVEFTRAKGWGLTDPDELEETTAEIYSDDRAFDLGLLPPPPGKDRFDWGRWFELKRE